jgi:hypothetical protein
MNIIFFVVDSDRAAAAWQRIEMTGPPVSVAFAGLIFLTTNPIVKQSADGAAVAVPWELPKAGGFGGERPCRSLGRIGSIRDGGQATPTKRPRERTRPLMV